MVGPMLTIAFLAVVLGDTSSVVPTGAANAPLREIGHVRAVSPFCTAFEVHFNGAARPILASDASIGAIGYTLGTIETHYRSRGAELLVYDDRVRLMHYVGDLQKTNHEARRELDALRASASLARDPESAAQTRELVAMLEKALDKQRQIATDSLGVVRAMMDVSLGTNDNSLVTRVVRDERSALVIDPLAHLEKIRDADGPRASTEVTQTMPGAYDAYAANTPANARDVRSYLNFEHQTDRVGDAESAAAAIAETLADRCR